ncbi:MAG: hypothetical protein ACQETQ_10445 [Spirochaetota bacterium]
METTERLKKKYDEIYEKTIDQLEYRLHHDESFSVRDLEQQLETFYVDQGNDWTGRGLPGEMVQSATVAATEAFLEKLRAERQADDIEGRGR